MDTQSSETQKYHYTSRVNNFLNSLCACKMNCSKATRKEHSIACKLRLFLNVGLSFYLTSLGAPDKRQRATESCFAESVTALIMGTTSEKDRDGCVVYWVMIHTSVRCSNLIA